MTARALVVVTLDPGLVAGLIVGAAALLAAIGYLVRLARAAALRARALATLVDQELTHNHGTSMKDDVYGIAIAVGNLAREFEELKGDFYHHLAERGPKTP